MEPDSRGAAICSLMHIWCAAPAVAYIADAGRSSCLRATDSALRHEQERCDRPEGSAAYQRRPRMPIKGAGARGRGVSGEGRAAHFESWRGLSG